MGRTISADLFRTVVIAGAAFLSASQAAAAPSTVNVGMNQGLRIAVAGTVANVVVTNPAIADVTVVDSHSVIVIGKGYGLAEVMVTDSGGRLLLDDNVNVALPLESVRTVYHGSTPQLYFCNPTCFAAPASPSQSGGAGAAPPPASAP